MNFKYELNRYPLNMYRVTKSNFSNTLPPEATRPVDP